MDKFEKIITSLKNELENNDKVLGLVLVGSTVRKNIYKATVHSDIEAYIVAKDQTTEEFEQELPKIVRSLGKVLFSYKNQWAGFSVVYEDLLRLELPIVEISNLKSVFDRPKAQPITILIDKTDGKLPQILDERPTNTDIEIIFEQTVKNFWYMAIVGAQYFKKGEFWNARHVMEVSLIPAIIKLIEIEKNPDVLSLESNKRIEEFIPENLQSIKKLSVKYDEEEIKKSLHESIYEFSDLTKELVVKNNYKPFDPENELKEKILKLLT